METLKTMWTALTTQNEDLASLIIMPLSFLEAYISMILFSELFNVKVSKKSKYIYVLFIGCFGIINNIIIPSPFNAFLNLFAFLLSNIFILKISAFKSIFSLVIPFVLTAICESLISITYPTLFKVDYLTATTIPIHRFSISLIIYFIMYLVFLSIKYLKINFKKLEIIDKKQKMLLSFNLIFGILLICTQVYITAFFNSNLPVFITIIHMLSLLIYFAVSIYSVFTISKLETTTINLEEAKLYNKTLEILQDNTKAFRHDFTNILLGMIGYMDKDDMPGLRKYHNQLLDDIKDVNNLTSLSPKLVNNPAIYNVLASKYHKADNLGIKINLEVFLDLNEFTRILGILLDNAIEATTHCKEKVINVTFRKNNRKHMQLLIIENTYSNKDIDTEKIYEKGYSTKEGNTGLGLWEVRQILRKNNNLNLFTTKNDKYFCQQFEIYYI